MTAWSGFGFAYDAQLAGDPVKSEAQRRAMCAAEHGNSTLGIPKSVGYEFCGKVQKDAAPLSDLESELRSRAKDRKSANDAEEVSKGKYVGKIRENDGSFYAMVTYEGRPAPDFSGKSFATRDKAKSAIERYLAKI